MSTIFAQLDGNGTPVEITRGSPFVTYRKLVEDAHDAVINLGAEIGTPVSFVVSHPAAYLDIWGPDDLARFCIQAVEMDDAPDGKVLASYTLGLDGDTITATPTFVDAPARELPVEVPMYRVRIVAAQQGLTTAVTDYIAGLDEPAKTIATELWTGAPTLIVAGDFAQGFKAAQGLSDADFAALIFAAEDLAL